MDVVQAAGGIMWRPGPRGRVLAVIRTKRGDWTLPKGKLRSGEDFEDAALREVEEETGCTARLGAFAGALTYTSRRGPKLVLYWHMTVLRERTFEPNDEVVELAWLTPGEALRRLDRERDLRLLRDALASERAAPGGRRAA